MHSEVISSLKLVGKVMGRDEEISLNTQVGTPTSDTCV